MSKTVAQIFATNPTTVVADTDLYYLVQSPYTPGTDAAITGASLKAAFGGGGTINPGLINQMAYYAASGSSLSGLATATNGVLVTSAGGVPSISSTLPSAVQGNITSLGTISSIGAPLGATFGGTGVNNGANTATFAGNLNFAAGFITSGAFAVTQTYTGITNVTFPTSGTLATTSQLPTPAALTRINDTNVTVTLGGTPATSLLQAVSLTLGWTGTLSGARGGTGVNNGASTITIGGNVAFSGAFTFAGTLTNNTAVTFPTSGTLATTSQIPSGAALTASNDTNITLTLGGSPTTALINAASITAGWTGTLSGTRGGTGVNNGASTMTIGGNVAFSGAFTFTGTLTANTSVTFPTSGTLLTAASINTYEAEGRLTLTTNVPVTTSDVTAATTLYYTPYIGDHISLFDGSSTWTTLQFTQLSIAVPASTSQLYDVFIFNSSGTATLELLAWTNDTTRATALVYQNGVLVKSGATTRRYVGSMRTTTVSGQTEDSLAKRYVYNYYNRVARPGRAVDATVTWNYSTNAFRQANANTANQLDFVIGVAEDNIYVQATSEVTNSTATGRQCKTGIGIDSTTVNSATKFTGNLVSNTIGFIITAEYNTVPTAGRHFYAWLESGGGTDTQTWDGTTVFATASTTQTGIIGWMMG
jgi:hypothetical protein